ncbi:class I SAM-dependent methyltransferase [Natronobacterium gregoryi]|uniref:Methyltransferase n=2 Tax=Natronobacterium gregoryi TaxID=44930 RepID=L0AKU2_NATGS|nr:class I SAM-dependent methyltransferase [Natronobacterium gregoryi]AFZ74426.1 hypothetical protein Natgr_3301 [Natronobacterium gregoryi SP2]ELY72114.1 methyltransferase family protein [Natronobacterium gregoryi SP2]PLK19755.1 methyltransferase [Natronobacterium gregoryi SP2]SFJ40761.1 hypothetical protein SAMN05443661_12727 [Natronobacterium gregoryi]
MPRTYSKERYLAAKRTVDDRALDRTVLKAFERRLEAGDHVVEVGAGIGTMLQRLLEWERLPETVTYTLVDVDGDAIATARERLPAWAEERDYHVEPGDSTGEFTLSRDKRAVTVRSTVSDATVAFDHEKPAVALDDEAPDAVVGSAFVDLFRPVEVETLLACLPSGCLCYFPITFDGETIFQPTAVPGFDEYVSDRYHEDMRRRANPGDPHAGRRLLECAANEHVCHAAGASDWIVTADDGSYPADEAYFLQHVLETVHTALEDDPAVDGDALESWIARRREQVESGELVYVAHGLDVLLGVDG